MAPQSPQRSMKKRRFLPRWLVVPWLCSLGIVRGADPSPQTDLGVLYLANGGFVAGKLADALPPMNGALDWQGMEFASPFRFPLGAVQAMVFPRAAKPEHAPETICFELVGGDVLFGSLKRIDADRIEIAESTLGDVTIRRDYLRRFYRKTRNHARIYAGPVNLAQWSQGPEQSLWREEAGRFLTDQAGAWLRKNVPLPAQAEIEIELSWTKPPNFVVAMGTCTQDDAELKAFRLEVVGTDLVAVRETNREADLAVITPLGPDEGHIHLTIYLDQPRGRLLVDTMSGTSLANLEIPNERSAVGPCLTLLNLRGDLSLQRLRIGHWNGVAPTSNAQGETRFQPSTGQLQNGRLTGFDEGDQTLTFRVGEEEVRVPLDQLDDVQLEPANEAHQPTSELSTIQISYHDGTCVTGVWLGTDSQQIALLPRGTLSAVCAPLTGVRAISFLQTRSTLGESREAPARLELAETRLPGRLVDGDERPDASCLTWLPDGSEKAAPLRKQAAGRIVFRTPPAAAATKARSDAAANRRPMAAPVLDIGKIINRNTVKTPKPAGNPGKFLHLRHGDVIPCEVKSIDERGVTIETPLSAATFVSHDQIKAVELIKSKGTPKLARLKRERLLTLPRMQKDLPPTQLLYSVGSNGDFLRGRIMEMDAETIQVEVRQEVRRIPRSRVAQIIWLPAGELEQEASEAVPEQENGADESMRVQAIRTDGIRLTVLAQRLSNGLLIGRNDVLGECRTDVQQTDQLVIGAEIERSTAKLAYARWKLHHAPEPKFVQEESGELVSGTDSPLVGRPAPDFTLPFLDGSEFKLSGSRGKVVVLDFWATWCGPCLQAMPQVEQVVSEFPESELQLAAVNLEESAKQVTATLARHQLKAPVVLDQDGIVARKYAASVIPQTVIIDRQGDVVRVFVGGGPDLADQLREALKAVLQPPTVNAEPADAAPPGDDLNLDMTP